MKSYSKSKLFLSLLAIAASSGCSKSNDAGQGSNTNNPNSISFPITNVKLSGCHFKDPKPVYAFQSTITPNPVQCDEGVARSAQLLTPSALPKGLEFSASTLTLTGVANESANQLNYQVYLENEAGYVIIPLKITVK